MSGTYLGIGRQFQSWSNPFWMQVAAFRVCLQSTISKNNPTWASVSNQYKILNWCRMSTCILLSLCPTPKEKALLADTEQEILSFIFVTRKHPSRRKQLCFSASRCGDSGVAGPGRWGPSMAPNSDHASTCSLSSDVSGNNPCRLYGHGIVVIVTGNAFHR